MNVLMSGRDPIRGEDLETVLILMRTVPPIVNDIRSRQA